MRRLHSDQNRLAAEDLGGSDTGRTMPRFYGHRIDDELPSLATARAKPSRLVLVPQPV
jgi:hypothetical protein